MKRQTLFTLFALICAASIIAQGVSYTPVEAAKHVGETTRITGTVDGVHQSGKGNIFLNMGGMYLSLHSFYSISERGAVSESSAVRRENDVCVWQNHFVQRQTGNHRQFAFADKCEVKKRFVNAKLVQGNGSDDFPLLFPV